MFKKMIIITAGAGYIRSAAMAVLHEADLVPERWRYRVEGAANCVFEYISVCDALSKYSIVLSCTTLYFSFCRIVPAG